uniref:Uncharacterized protein n=1 Tax=Tanacetum cinerariifolium TaxID=118510 RepID=A0A6L2M1W7_TANCI|nr:hypothetical protein [Tanacetum cinerariifolium]
MATSEFSKKVHPSFLVNFKNDATLSPQNISSNIDKVDFDEVVEDPFQRQVEVNKQRRKSEDSESNLRRCKIRIMKKRGSQMAALMESANVSSEAKETLKVGNSIGFNMDDAAKELKIYLLGSTSGIRASVIKNGNKVLKKTVGTVEQIYEPTSVEEKLDRKNEMKARGTLSMTLSNKDQLKFHSYQDAKLLMKAIEKRLQRLISQLEIHGSSSISQNPQNVAFVSFDSTTSTTSTNEADNTAYGVSTAHAQGNSVNSTSVDNLSDAVICVFLTSQPNSPQLDREDLEQIDPDDLEETDLHWEMTMLTIRASRFIKRTGRNLDINGQKIGFDKSKVECFNRHKNGHFTRECRALKNQENKGRDYGRKTVLVENPTKNALIAQDRIRGYDCSYQAEEEHPINYALMALTSSKSSSSSDSKENVKSRSDKGYHAVLPPYTGNYIPPKPDLMFTDEQVESKSVDVVFNVSSSALKTVELKVESVDVRNKGVYSTVETKLVKKNNFSTPIIEDWISDDETCFVYGSFEHLHYVCDQKAVRLVWNNTRRVNHKNFANKITHPHPKRRFVPQAILTKSCKLKTGGTPVNTVRPVNTADSKPIVNYSRLISNTFKRGYSQVIRPDNKYLVYKKTIFNKMVNTIRVKDTTARERAVETNAILLIMKIMMVDLFPLEMGTGSGSGPRCQVIILEGAKAQTRFEDASKQSNDPPLLRVHTLGSGEDNIKLKGIDEILYKTVLIAS